MLKITDTLTLEESEVETQAIRAQGAGGQNVNKVSSAIHLRFDIRASSLPEAIKQRLLDMADHRITHEGVVVIKAQTHRRQEQNRDEALARLVELIQRAAHRPKKRKPTKPTRSSQRKRLDSKTRHARNKQLRGKPDLY